MSDKIGLCLSVNHNSWKAGWNYTDSVSPGNIYHADLKRSVTSILARINVHFGITEKLDPYWGIGAGYRVVDWVVKSTGPNPPFSFKNPFHAGFETTLGLRYYITEGFGLYGEIGLAQSFIQGGLVVAL